MRLIHTVIPKPALPLATGNARDAAGLESPGRRRPDDVCAAAGGAARQPGGAVVHAAARLRRRQGFRVQGLDKPAAAAAAAGWANRVTVRCCRYAVMKHADSRWHRRQRFSSAAGMPVGVAMSPIAAGPYGAVPSTYPFAGMPTSPHPVPVAGVRPGKHCCWHAERFCSLFGVLGA
jgi:hypothetical protein